MIDKEIEAMSDKEIKKKNKDKKYRDSK